MSGECDKCGEHCVDCKCKPWKPDKYVCCPNCEDILFISSVIPMNGQVNFACANNDCPTSGFIHQGTFYFNDGT